MPTNPFTTSNRRQQILVPKELFPRKNGDASIISTASSSSSSYRRPVKLPLRKHHSFHFQPSQTVAGVLKHEQYQQKHHSTQVSTKERYKNQGPLVFKPFSEKSAFKPIVPSPKGSNDSDDSNRRNDFIETSTMPRICGTSLKRHISNVETFSTTNQWQSDNEDANVTVASASGLTVNRRKIHYADLAPLPSSNVNSIHRRNDRNNNSNSNEDTDIVDGNSSSSGNSSCSKPERQTTANDGTSSSGKLDHKLIQKNQSNASPSSTTTTKTQYATLRFDEISI